MIMVNAKEFSKVMHALGHNNSTAQPGMLHTESKKGVKHTVWKNEEGYVIGEIQKMHPTDPAVHHINTRVIPNWRDLLDT